MLDTGVTNWNDLSPGFGGDYSISALTNGYNFVNGNTITNDIDPNGHGTTVASVLNAVGNNGVGLAGMTWYSYSMPVVVATPNGQGGTTSNPRAMAQGINYAVAHGAQIINISYASTANDPDVAAAVANAINNNVMVVASAGNGANGGPGQNINNYPAAYPGVIGVGGIDTSSATNQKWAGSNYGNWVQVAAPATQIATYKNGAYWSGVTGTSYAVPQVAGLAALIRATNPSWNMNTIASVILNNTATVLPTGGLPTFKHGMIQPYTVLYQAWQSARKDGDMNCDGVLTVSDSIITLQTSVGMRPQTDSYLKHGDLAPFVDLGTDNNGTRHVNPYGDGSITAADALMSLRADVGLDVWSGMVAIKSPSPIIYKSTVTLTGTVPAGSTVQLTGEPGATIGQVNYTSDTTWSCTVSSLSAGSNSFTVTGTDTSGGIQQDTVQVNFVPTQTIAAGGNHTAALKGDGTAWAWGYNVSGQLGNGTTNNSTTPVQASGLSELATIAAGYEHTVALKNDGTVWAWGYNVSGQLGNGTTNNSTTPVEVSGLGNVTAVGGGGYHTLALMGDGTVQSWGNNTSGQLGNGATTNSTTPVHVSGLTGVKAISAGYVHSVALLGDGTVWAWGDNSLGQLGNGTTNDSVASARVSGLTGVKAIAAGILNTVALKGDGTVWTWGWNNYGQLGNGTITDSTTPVQVTGLSNVTGIATGGYHNVALKDDGTVWTWGSNNYGQLGDGTITDRYVPVQVNNISDAVAIVAGIYHTAVMKKDGTIQTWGDNNYGQLGVATINQSITPVQVQTFNVNDPSPPVTTAIPLGGNYDTAQTVTLSVSEQASTYFTMDGTIPTYPVSGTTQIYNSPLYIASNIVLKYFSRDMAGNNENMQTQSYTISTQGTVAPVPALSPYALVGVIVVLAGFVRGRQPSQ